MKSDFSCFDEIQKNEISYETPSVPDVARVNIHSKLTTFLRNLCAALLKSNELQVHQHRDRKGNTWWRAFDPVTDESVSFGSEAEMRSWIEQRYYR